MHRREFLRRAAATTGVVALGDQFWHHQFSLAAIVTGPGPYGSLEAADVNGVQLPAGFSARVLATTGVPVAPSTYVWHGAPDGGACFPTADGWVYVSNSELPTGAGGAAALRFDATGAVADAYRILADTSRNCAGGPTTWSTWLSCEENGVSGMVYECNPFGGGQGVQRPALGSFNHEAAGVDPATGIVYLTEDDPNGRLYRFVPAAPGDLSSGSLFAASVSGSTVTWLPTMTAGPDRQATTTVFNGGEGIWVHGGRLFFTTKGDGRVWELVLATQTLTVLYDDSTTAGAPLTGVDNITVHEHSGDLYVAEDGGNMEICLIAFNNGLQEVTPFLRVNGQATSELTGPAFSPDGTRLYFSSQRGADGVTGITYEVTGPFRLSPPNVGPAAQFTSTVTNLSVAFDASGSTDTDGAITNYAWDFGDTTTATGISTTHTYAAAGIYTVTLTVTDDDNATNTHTTTITVAAGPVPPLAADTFTRTTTNSWGTADTGGAWTTSGTAAAFAVNNGTGAITGAPGSNRATYLTGVTTNDIDLTTDASLNTRATGGGTYLSFIARRVSNGNDYRAKLRYTSDNRVSVYLNRTINNTETVLTWTTIPNLTLTPGDTLRIRVQATGTNPTTLRVKVWRATTTEPTTWLLTTTDTTPLLQNTGHPGLLLYTSSSWTGTNPTTRIDNLTARNTSAPPAPPPNVGPAAQFTSTVTNLSVAFDASGSTDTDGAITNYAWDFGDTTTATGISTTHTYAAAGIYTVTLTVTDDENATNTHTTTITVAAGPVPPLAADTFTRTTTNSWGTADTGGAWTTSGTAAAFAVNNGTGAITGAPGSNRATYLTGVTTNDIDLTTDASLNTRATGGGTYLSFIARRVSNGNDYRAKLRYTSDNRVSVYLNRTINNTETVLTWTTIPNLTLTPGDTLRIRVQATGTNPTTLRVKVWRATTTEPTTWLLTTTDTTPLLQNTGHPGLLLYTSSSWTGTNPTTRIDNLVARRTV